MTTRDWGYCLYNNDAKHPIEFSFDVNESSISSAQLLLLCNDVDQYTEPGNPEIDKVYVNNNYIGDLTGANEEDSTTLFSVPASALTTGNNRVRIEVNQNPGTPSNEWCVKLIQAQLLINGGCTGRASCRSVSTNAGSYAPGATVAVTYEIDTAATSQQIRVESNLLNPDGVIVAGTERNYTTNGSANDPKTVNLPICRATRSREPTRPRFWSSTPPRASSSRPARTPSPSPAAAVAATSPAARRCQPPPRSAKRSTSPAR